MGLLEKATHESLNAGLSPGEESPALLQGDDSPTLENGNPIAGTRSTGLLGKAEKFRGDLQKQPGIPEGFQPTGLLKKAERLLDEEKRFSAENLESTPEVDEFELWEEEAKEASAKAPMQPIEEDPIPPDEDFLFDDDSDFSTAPIEYHLASKKKIENYHSAFEITKELAGSSSFDSFFANLNYSITGQIGVDSFAVFSNTGESFETIYLLEYQGFEPEGDWSFTESDETYKMLKKSDSVLYAGELLSMELPWKEKDYLEKMGCEILAPIRDRDAFYGFIALGRLINGEEYITDDLEFIKIIAEIAGSVFERVRESEEKIREIEELKQNLATNKSILDFSKSISDVRKFDIAYDLLVDQMVNNFGLEKFTFLVFDPLARDEYKVFSSNQLSPETIEKFRLGRSSDIIGMISNVSEIYELENFRTNPELLSLLPNDDLGIMDECLMIPIINLNWLVAIIMVHKKSKPWLSQDKETIFRLMEISAPIFANIMILDKKENVFSHPFSPLEDRLTSEIQKANDLDNPFTVVVFKVQNTARMIQLLGELYFAKYCDGLRKTIMEYLGENDHYIQVGRGKFAIILHAKDKEESEIVVRKIKAEFQPEESPDNTSFRPSYRILSLSYPMDTKTKDQFMEMVEEA